MDPRRPALRPQLLAARLGVARDPGVLLHGLLLVPRGRRPGRRAPGTCGSTRGSRGLSLWCIAPADFRSLFSRIFRLHSLRREWYVAFSAVAQCEETHFVWRGEAKRESDDELDDRRPERSEGRWADDPPGRRKRKGLEHCDRSGERGHVRRHGGQRHKLRAVRCLPAPLRFGSMDPRSVVLLPRSAWAPTRVPRRPQRRDATWPDQRHLCPCS